MEIHICENCVLTEQTVNDQLRKYDIISEENISLHRALLTARNDNAKQELELKKLRDCLWALRKKNLQLSLEHNMFKQPLQQSLSICLNLESSGSKNDISYRKVFIRPTSASFEEEIISKYDELVALIEKQKQQYEEDLIFFLDSNNNSLIKMEKQLKDAQEHRTIMLDLCEVMYNELVYEQNENKRLQELSKTTIDVIHKKNKVEMRNMRKQIIDEAHNLADANIKKNINILEQQLSQRDKLMSQLYKHMCSLEAFISRQNNEHQIVKEKYLKMHEDLRRKILFVQEKYTKLLRRKRMDHEGFLNDINNIHQEMKRFKDNLQKIQHECTVFNVLSALETTLLDLQETIETNYSCK